MLGKKEQQFLKLNGEVMFRNKKKRRFLGRRRKQILCRQGLERSILQTCEVQTFFTTISFEREFVFIWGNGPLSFSNLCTQIDLPPFLAKVVCVWRPEIDERHEQIIKKLLSLVFLIPLS